MFEFEVMFLIVLGLIWIIFATIQDIRTKEVSDWLNFSLVIFALSFRFFYDLFSLEVFSLGGFMFFYQGVIGFAIFFALANLFYYSRLFGGGDAKLMYGLGAVLPFSVDFFSNLKIFVVFIFIFFFVGAIYGLIGSFILFYRNFKEAKKKFKKIFNSGRNLCFFSMSFGLVLMFSGFFISELFYFGTIVFIMPLLFVFSKAVDESAMVKLVEVSKLREGDLLYANVKVGGKIINKNWNGLENKEISLIKKFHQKVKIREGIAYVPVFLISFIVLLFFINSNLWNTFW
jgi:Flp pilus assembly protein protease CpaA